MEELNVLTEYLPILIPIIVIEAVLAITALIHLFKHDRYRFGNRVFWIFVILFIQIIGPILYFTVGKGDD